MACREVGGRARVGRCCAALLLVLGGEVSARTAIAQVSSQAVFASDQLRLTLVEEQGRVRGSLLFAGQEVALRGALQQGRIQGAFEHQGQLVPFEASFDASALVLSVGGAQYRLTRQGSAPAVGTPTGGGMQPSEVAALAARYPNVLSLPGGTVLRYARDWMVQDLGGMKALLPPPVAGQAMATAMYACVEAPWSPAFSLASPEAVAHLVGWMGQMLPGLRQLGPPEALATGSHGGLRLRFEAPAVTGVATYVELLVRNQGHSLLSIVGMGDRGGLAAHERTVLDMLRMAELRAVPAQPQPVSVPYPQGQPHVGAPPQYGPAPAQGMQGRSGMGPLGPIDTALVGTWRSSSSNSDWRHDMTLVTETFYVLNPDGTYAYGSRMAGGGFGNTIDGNARIVSQGYWSASNGVFSMMDQSGKRDQVGYTFHQGQFVMKLNSGKYSFWSR